MTDTLLVEEEVVVVGLIVMHVDGLSNILFRKQGPH